MRIPVRSLATLAVLALAACSGGGGTPTTVPAAPPGPGSGNLAPTSAFSGPVDYGAEALQGATYQGAAKLKTVDIGVMVKLRDAAGLAQYAREVSDPKSGNYRDFLTPDGIAQRFGATQSDYAAVAAYFRTKGLAVMGWRQRELLRIAGPQAAMEAALGAKFGSYTKNGQTFVSLTAPPSRLATLPITNLVGATTYAQIKHAPVRLGAPTSASGYSPQQIAAAFDYNGGYAAGYTGTGITVGIIGSGPISATDLATYKAIYHLSGSSTVTQVDVTDSGTGAPTGTFATPPPTTDTCPVPSTGPDASCNPEDGEAQIDTQQAAGLAPNATVLFYLGYAPNFGGKGTNYEGLPLAEYEVQQAISDNRADVLSLSYGIGEQDDVGGDFSLLPNGMVNPNSPGPAQFATLAALGIAVFVASGDNGALNCLRDGNANTENDLCVTYPATDTNVVAVGGVNTPLGNNGRFVGPITGWGLQTGGGRSASGGGISRYFPAPSFQSGAAGVSGSTRNTPDVSLEGDAVTGVAVVINAAFPDGGIGAAGGTSVAAPEAAGMWALVLQACKQNPSTCHAAPGNGGVSYRLGNPNPLFYQIYASSTVYPATFYDVLFGDNSQLPACGQPNAPTPCSSPTPIAGYQAGSGYDRVTGIGVPFGRALIKAVAGV